MSSLCKLILCLYKLLIIIFSKLTFAYDLKRTICKIDKQLVWLITILVPYDCKFVVKKSFIENNKKYAFY